MTGTRVYRSWKNMLNRCRNPNVPAYKNYGGRGIKVCKRWFKFENFFADMGLPPEEHEIERKNNNGNYTPKNCIWLHQSKQARNTRRNVYVLYKGERLTLAEAARASGIDHHKIKTLFPLA